MALILLRQGCEVCDEPQVLCRSHTGCGSRLRTATALTTLGLGHPLLQLNPAAAAHPVGIAIHLLALAASGDHTGLAQATQHLPNTDSAASILQAISQVQPLLTSEPMATAAPVVQAALAHT